MYLHTVGAVNFSKCLVYVVDSTWKHEVHIRCRSGSILRLFRIFRTVRTADQPCCCLNSLAMLDGWRDAVTPDTHFRQLSALAGQSERLRVAGKGKHHVLPVEDKMSDLRALIRDIPVSGVRSPPGSGKTMVLPDVLREWADERRQTWNNAVVVIFPTQYGAQNINTSFIDFRQRSPDAL